MTSDPSSAAAYRRSLFAGIRQGKASLGGVAEALRLVAPQVEACLSGRHCWAQEPDCAAARSAADHHDPCHFCGEASDG